MPITGVAVREPSLLAQVAGVELILAVGRGFTFTITVLLLVHPRSDVAVTEYVVVVVGDTFIVGPVPPGGLLH